MSFGSTTPIELAIAGTDFAAQRQYAQKLKDALGHVPSLRDLQFEQELEYPAIKVDVDRARAAMLGITAEQASRSLAEATSSSGIRQPTTGRPEEWRGIPGPGAGADPEDELGR